MGGRWSGFVADEAGAKALQEPGNPDHRVRVEYNRETILVHLSDEDGSGWTCLAVDRRSRAFAVGQAQTQLQAAREAVSGLTD